MPVIVVGADTPLGELVADTLSGRGGEVRTFVTDPEAAGRLRSRRIKVAMGDVSDGSHVEAAALGCFTAILVGEAAVDRRQRSFSSDPAETTAGWLKAAAGAGVQRLIWLGDSAFFDRVEARAAVPEVIAVAVEGRKPADLATEVAQLDDLGELDEV